MTSPTQGPIRAPPRLVDDEDDDDDEVVVAKQVLADEAVTMTDEEESEEEESEEEEEEESEEEESSDFAEYSEDSRSASPCVSPTRARAHAQTVPDVRRERLMSSLLSE